MTPSGVNSVTRLLQAVQDGDPQAAEQLLPIVYEELRRLAKRKMSSEAAGQTLQPTALVHEAWLRLTGDADRRWNDRTHFFATAAEAMRRILVETARRKRAQRHGGSHERVELEEITSPTADNDDQLLAVNEALEKFAAQSEHKQKAQLVKLRYFVGMTIEEAAETLGISTGTAKRHWAYASAWLYEEICRANSR